MLICHRKPQLFPYGIPGDLIQHPDNVFIVEYVVVFRVDGFVDLLDRVGVEDLTLLSLLSVLQSLVCHEVR